MVACSDAEPLIVWADRGSDAVYAEAIADYQRTHPEVPLQYTVYTHDFLWQSVKLGRPVDVILSGTAAAQGLALGCQPIQQLERPAVLVFAQTDTATEGCCLMPEDGHLAKDAAELHIGRVPHTCQHVALHPHQLGRFLNNGLHPCGFAYSTQLTPQTRQQAVGLDTVASYSLTAFRVDDGHPQAKSFVRLLDDAADNTKDQAE